MGKITLYFATNRNHKGNSQWKPSGYGKQFSKHGTQNLRFGELTMEVDDRKVEKYLNAQAHGRAGDGEGLSGYFSKMAKTADISAYADPTAQATEVLPAHQNSSVRMFQNLKRRMEEAADVLIFIHGYNVSWNEAVGTALSLQCMLNRKDQEADKDVMVVLFTWPSDGSMLPYAAYKSDRIDAQGSGQAVGRAILKLRDFLLTLWKNAQKQEEQLCNREIHLLCHSMGNYVLQNAVAKMIDHANGPTLPRLFHHIFLCSPDVDEDVLEPGKPMGRLHEMCRNVSVYYNHGDVALFISDHTKGNPERLGHVGNVHPLLVHNKVHQIDCSVIVKGAIEHSYFLWATVNDDIRQTIHDVAFDAPGRFRKRVGPSREWVME